MAHAFKTIPGKSSFGVVKESVYQSDYISRIKTKNMVCNKKINNVFNVKNPVSDYNQLNQLKHLDNSCGLPFNKSNLVTNIYSKIDLQYVCVIGKGNTGINSNDCNTGAGDTGCNMASDYTQNSPFYQQYIIDPCGALFGNTPCGVNNFTNYMVYYPPTSN